MPTTPGSRLLSTVQPSGVIRDWVLSEDTRYGNRPFGPASVKTTVASSAAAAPPFSSTPCRAELPASTRFSIVATTCAEVNGVPSENVTPSRSLKVHSEASALADHSVASIGCSERSAAERTRYSKTCAQTL